MPAVVADTITLPRFAAPSTDALVRRTRSVTTAPQGFEGEGFPVRRAFAGVPMADLDPFVHLDQMGEVEYAPGEPKGTPWHPHRGFETVTYMLDGALVHQDSHGGGGLIADGATQWMTAGNGILHIETPPEALVVSGGLFHGFQLWVNLPGAHKLRPPAYQALEGSDVTLASSPDGGALLRVIAGELPGAGAGGGVGAGGAGEDGVLRGPGSTFTPITLIHATLAPGAQLDLPWRSDFNALVYALSGNGFAGRDRDRLRFGQLAVLGSATGRPAAAVVGSTAPSGGEDGAGSGSVLGRPARDRRGPSGLADGSRHASSDGVAAGPFAGLFTGPSTVLRIGADTEQDARSPGFDVLIMGGRPIREPVAMYGPFVMNTEAELQQAVEDFQAGRLGVIPENALMPHVVPPAR